MLTTRRCKFGGACFGSLLSRAPRHRCRRQTRAGSSHRNRRPAVPPSASAVSSPVSSCVRISLLAGSTEICGLRHERRVSPCLARAHSPAPKNFRPVESSTISVGHLFVLVSTTTSTVRRRRDSVVLIRHLQIAPHRVHEGTHKAFRLAQRQSEYHPQHQCRGNRQL